MIILTVNTGSSSVRLAAFACDGRTLTELVNVRHDLTAKADEPEVVLREFAQTHGITSRDVSVHRVVHGGAALTTSRLLDQEVEREIDRLAPLAPLHNPAALHWIRATREVLGADITQVAVFDTAFFKDLPGLARTYAIPHALAKKHGLRRYGFHGLAHQAMWRKWRELQPDIPHGGRVISMQLGAGCSITAIDNGTPRDTSMGFSPLEGLIMATRSGDIDPGLVTFLQRQENLGPGEIDQLLNERSGLLGVSGMSADMRQLSESQDECARLAVDLYCYRARKYLGAYLAVLGGAEAIVFGGGVGENVPAVREKILAGMGWCGIEIDSKRNHGSGGVLCVSSPESRAEVWVIPVDEAAILAQEALAVIAAKENRVFQG
ncbi:acetate/propionate family kinase [Nitrosospira sp. Nl5]|uniref:acetate/propionate family kinase n=1 Tax=Nitrosospira sp. Nl5 TaxID=200120 RepID=UPI000B8680A2|nr:acetate/propionate family kinase [Nitrosospira sp. Nl5]